MPSLDLRRRQRENFLVGYTALDPCLKLQNAVEDLEQQIADVEQAIAANEILPKEVPTARAYVQRLKAQLANLRAQLKRCEDG